MSFFNTLIQVFSSLRQNRKTQLILTCSKLTIETMEKGVKYVQSLNKNTREYFTPFSSVFIVDFEQVNVSWVTNFAKRFILDVLQGSK